MGFPKRCPKPPYPHHVERALLPRSFGASFGDHLAIVWSVDGPKRSPSDMSNEPVGHSLPKWTGSRGAGALPEPYSRETKAWFSLG